MRPLHAALIPLMFAHWVGWKISLIYMLILATLFLLTKLINGRLYLHKVLLGILLFCAFFLAVNLTYIFEQNTDLVFSNLHLYLSLFLVVAFILFSSPWNTSEIYIGARAIFWIAFYVLIVEFLAVNFLGISKEIMPGVRYSPSYFEDLSDWHRPFGLTGQASANGGILLLSFLLLVEFRVIDVKSVFALLLGVLLTMSGQAILSTALILGLLQLNKIRRWLFKSIFVLVFSSFIFFVLNLDLHQKISLDYLYYVLLDKAHLAENLDVLNSWQLLWGTLGLVAAEEGYGTEVFLIQSIRLFGVIFTILFWLFVWFLVKMARLKFIWFICCFVTSLHYPTVLYIEAQLILALLYLSTLLNSNPLTPKTIQEIKTIPAPYSSGQNPV